MKSIINRAFRKYVLAAKTSLRWLGVWWNNVKFNSLNPQRISHPGKIPAVFLLLLYTTHLSRTILQKKLQMEISNVLFTCINAEIVRTIPFEHIYIIKHYEKKIAADSKQNYIQLSTKNFLSNGFFSGTPNKKSVVDFLQTTTGKISHKAGILYIHR